MADLKGALDLLRGATQAVQGIGAIGTFMDEANKLRASSPELQAQFITKSLNDKDKLGVKFETEGTVSVARLTTTQSENLIKAYSQLSEPEREKLFGGKLNLSIDTSPNSDGTTSVTLKVDAKKIQNWGQFSQAMEYFNGKDGSAPALKAAITTGNVDNVRAALGGHAPAAGQGQESPASSPQQPAEPPKKKNAWDILRDLKDKIPGQGTPGTAPTGGEGGPQSSVEQPIDVAALTAKLGLKAPSAEAQAQGSSATYGGSAPARSTDRNVG